MSTSESELRQSIEEAEVVGGALPSAAGVPPQVPPGIRGGPSESEEPSDDEEPGRDLRGGAPPADDDAEESPPLTVARLTAGRSGTRRRVRAQEAAESRRVRTPKERLLLLDTWMRSKLPAREFAALTGMSSHTLYDWKRRFEAQGPAGLCDGRRGGRGGSRLPEEVRRDARGVERCVAIACVRQFGPRVTARAISCAQSTLRWWEREQVEGRLAPGARGPRRRRATREERRSVRRFLNDHGRHTGTPSLRAAFPRLSRRELMEIKCQWVRQRDLLRLRRGSRLTWRRPGATWAMDFTDLPERTACGERALLFVHDLASGQVLWARPCRRKDAATVAEAIRALSAEHGAPLVIRIDNGKALHARCVRAVLEPHRVTLLRTPNRTPGYNGSCESGLGWHKRRITDVAERDGGIGAWGAEEFETMRLRANDARRPWSWSGPSPSERFAARDPITPEERSEFLAAVDAHRDDERLRRDALCEGRHKAAIERAAIRRALVDLGHLEINPRRVSTDLSSLKLANN